MVILVILDCKIACILYLLVQHPLYTYLNKLKVIKHHVHYNTLFFLPFQIVYNLSPMNIQWHYPFFLKWIMPLIFKGDKIDIIIIGTSKSANIHIN